MTFTGTLIENLMATVERVEKKAQGNEPPVVETMLVDAAIVQASIVEPWLVPVSDNSDYESKFLGVA